MGFERNFEFFLKNLNKGGEGELKLFWSGNKLTGKRFFIYYSIKDTLTINIVKEVFNLIVWQPI